MPTILPAPCPDTVEERSRQVREAVRDGLTRARGAKASVASRTSADGIEEKPLSSVLIALQQF